MERNLPVDAVRLLAIAAIVLMHTQPFAVLAAESRDYKYLFVVLNQSARFAVPFFFVVAGYYWGLRIREGSAVLDVSTRALGRLTLAFVAWSLVYLLPLDARAPELLDPARYPEAAWMKLTTLARDPVRLLLEGTAIHLWFLPALACAILISAALARTGALLPATAMALYLAGLAAKSYAATPVGIELPGLNTRDGPFFSLLPFVAGYYLSARPPAADWARTGSLIFALGYVMHFAEIFALLKLYQVRAVGHDYVLGTWLMGLGAAMVALSGCRLLRNATLAAAAGRLTLGVYAIHVLFLQLLAPHFWPRTNPPRELVLVAAVFALSLASCWLLSKVRTLRGLVA